MECSPEERIATATSPVRTRSGPSICVRLDHAGPGAGDVVLVRRQQPRVLGRLAAHEGAAGQPAALGDAGDDRGDPLGHDLADRDVVGHEQRLGAADDQVVDDHADQVDPDGVVHAHPLGDGDLGPDPVRRRRQQRTPEGLSAEASKSPANPPRPPTTSRRCARPPSHASG